MFREPALAPPPFLRCAHLIVDDDADARFVAQRALHGFKPGARIEGSAGWDIRMPAMAVRIIAYNSDTLYALGAHLCGYLRDGELAVHRLAAGHGDRIIIKDFVCHPTAGSNGLAYGEASGMEIGAVADIGENMRLARERRLTRPQRTF